MIMLSGNSGYGTLLHEFFHTIENLTGISPAHGFRSPEQFPEWKGTTELDYYRRHFETTLSRFGFDKLNFINRYPAGTVDIEVYKKVRDAYHAIPIDNRQEANSLVIEAAQSRNKDNAYKLYDKALQLSPYQPKALDFMVSWFMQKKDAVKTYEFQKKLKDIAAISTDYPVFDFYYFLKETKSGRVIGNWSKDVVTTAGSELSWDVGNFLNAPGTYHVTFLFTGGQKAVTIEWAALFENGKLICKDTHIGWSGNSKRDIVYRFEVENMRQGASYILKARLKGEGGSDSFGDVLMRKVED
jgi:hypothetical protein